MSKPNWYITWDNKLVVNAWQMGGSSQRFNVDDTTWFELDPEEASSSNQSNLWSREISMMRRKFFRKAGKEDRLHQTNFRALLGRGIRDQGATTETKDKAVKEFVSEVILLP